MAALLHQAALQPPHPTPKPNPWMHASTPSLSLPHAAPSRRRRAPARRLQAAGSDRAIDTPATDGTSSSDTPTKAPSSKKTSRKEKQRQQQRLREREQQQEQMLRASLVEAAAAAGQEGGDGSDDELPQAVFDRILQRILFTVGVPMASGVALLNVYDALKRGRGVVVPPWVPLLTILIAFGTSALGIAYGTLSASWDPEKEGSLLGIDEARTNWPELWKEENEKDKEK